MPRPTPDRQTTVPTTDFLPRSVWAAILGSRGLMVVVALLLLITSDRTLSGLINNWDVVHFVTIAQHGYAGAEPKDVAFFPGLPFLLSLGQAVGISPLVFGTVLSIGSSILAAAALVRLGGQWAAIGWMFAPVAIFAAVPYTESLFCALAFWAWVLARRGEWMVASALAAGACAVRVSGLFLWGALGVLVLTTVPWRQWWRSLGWLVLPPLVLAGYAWYLYGLTGSWTAWYAAQEAGWQRSLTWPWESVYRTVEMIASGYVDANGWGVAVRGEVLAFAVGLLTVGWCLGRRLWAEASWVGVQLIAFSMSYWLMSVNRAVLLWFPTWMMFATLLEYRPASRAGRILHHGVLVVICAGSVAMMLWWAQQFFRGQWAS